MLDKIMKRPTYLFRTHAARMTRLIAASGLLLGTALLPATAEEALPPTGDERALSIEGENEESPRELYIIPWQDSRPENTETEATRLLFDDLEPIDPEVFRRQIQYYTAPFEDQ